MDDCIQKPSSKKCSHCTAKFHDAESLISHMRDHVLSSRSMKCPHCGVKLSSEKTHVGDTYFYHLVLCKKLPKAFGFIKKNEAEKLSKVSSTCQEISNFSSSPSEENKCVPNLPGKPGENKVKQFSTLSKNTLWNASLSGMTQKEICVSVGISPNTAQGKNASDSVDKQNGLNPTFVSSRSVIQNSRGDLFSNKNYTRTFNKTKKSTKDAKPKAHNLVKGLNFSLNQNTSETVIHDLASDNLLQIHEMRKSGGLSKLLGDSTIAKMPTNKLKLNGGDKNKNGLLGSSEQCYVCFKKFQTADELNSHMLEVHVSKYYYSAAKRSHIINSSLSCNYCDDLFSSARGLNEHKLVCKLKKNSKKTKVHFEPKSKQNSSVLETKKKSRSTFSNLVTVNKFNSDKIKKPKKITLDERSVTFPNDNSCIVVKQKNKFKCVKCGDLFRDFSGVSKHADLCTLKDSSEAFNDEDMIWVCKLCEHGFKSSIEFVSHKPMCNKISKKPIDSDCPPTKIRKRDILTKKTCKYWCYTCGYNFPSENSFKNHPCDTNIKYIKSCRVLVQRHKNKTVTAKKPQEGVSANRKVRRPAPGVNVSRKVRRPAPGVSAGRKVRRPGVGVSRKRKRSQSTVSNNWKCTCKCCENVFTSKEVYEDHVQKQQCSFLSFCSGCNTTFGTPLLIQLHKCTQVSRTAATSQEVSTCLVNSVVTSNAGNSFSPNPVDEEIDCITLDDDDDVKPSAEKLVRTNHEIFGYGGCAFPKMEVMDAPCSVLGTDIQNTSQSAMLRNGGINLCGCNKSSSASLSAQNSCCDISSSFSSQPSSSFTHKSQASLTDNTQQYGLCHHASSSQASHRNRQVALCGTHCAHDKVHSCSQTLNSQQSSCVHSHSCSHAHDVNHKSSDSKLSHLENLHPASQCHGANVPSTRNVPRHPFAQSASSGMGMQSNFSSRSAEHEKNKHSNLCGSNNSALNYDQTSINDALSQNTAYCQQLLCTSNYCTSRSVCSHAPYISGQTEFSGLDIPYHPTPVFPTAHNSSVRMYPFNFHQLSLPQTSVSRDEQLGNSPGAHKTHDGRALDSGVSSSSFVSESSEISVRDVPVISHVGTVDGFCDQPSEPRNINVVFIEDKELCDAYAVMKEPGGSDKSVDRYICKQCHRSLNKPELVASHLETAYGKNIGCELKVTVLQLPKGDS